VIDSACNRYEYQGYVVGSKGGRCVGLTNLPPFGNLEASPGLYRSCFSFKYIFGTVYPQEYCWCLCVCLRNSFWHSTFEHSIGFTSSYHTHVSSYGCAVGLRSLGDIHVFMLHSIRFTYVSFCRHSRYVCNPGPRTLVSLYRCNWTHTVAARSYLVCLHKEKFTFSFLEVWLIFTFTVLYLSNLCLLVFCIKRRHSTLFVTL